MFLGLISASPYNFYSLIRIEHPPLPVKNTLTPLALVIILAGSSLVTQAASPEEPKPAPGTVALNPSGVGDDKKASADVADSTAPLPTASAEILTPLPAAEPRINGPRIFGMRPGTPCLYTIPTTGERPLRFSVDHLPVGLQLDPVNGRLNGTLSQPGNYPMVITASNARGTATKHFTIVVGDKLALTPPLGWSSWNCWLGTIDQTKTLAAAKAMAASGLINHGWTYVNVDDGWQGQRGGPFNALQGNKNFPDIPGLSQEIHSLGLKFGLYSTPWISSYAGNPGGTSNNEQGVWDPADTVGKKRVLGKYPYCIGTYSMVAADAQQYASWGVDYMKYDWCPIGVPETADASTAFKACGRNIVFSLSNSTPFAKIKDLAPLAQSWRTTNDMYDMWKHTGDTFLRGVAEIGFEQNHWAPFAEPGHWNDPDMMVLGWVGQSEVRGKPFAQHYTRLTPDEQYSHMSLWCIISAPLILGCDLERLDAFTLGLLTNDEVLAINQDALGKQGVRVASVDEVDFYKKELEDDSWAVGIFNRSDRSQTVAQSLGQLGIPGNVHVRDLWRQKDLPDTSDSIGAEVASHGVVLLKLTPIR